MAIQDDINNLKAKIGLTPTNPTMMPEPKGVVTDKEAVTIQEALGGDVENMQNAAQASDMDVQMQEYNEKVNTPGTYEYMAEQLAKQLRDSMEPMSEEQLQFINARQELIDEVLMPLSNAGYQDLVYTILNRPRDSAEHNQASIQLAEVMAQWMMSLTQMSMT